MCFSQSADWSPGSQPGSGATEPSELDFKFKRPGST